jgi:hypothetical protein
VVLGFQEIGESSASNLIGGGNSQAAIKTWNDHVLRTLKEKSGGKDYM